VKKLVRLSKPPIALANPPESLKAMCLRAVFAESAIFLTYSKGDPQCIPHGAAPDDSLSPRKPYWPFSSVELSGKDKNLLRLRSKVKYLQFISEKVRADNISG
jgi:hypothetical protein